MALSRARPLEVSAVTTSATFAWFVSLLRASSAWLFSSILQPAPPLTPAHGWLLLAPATKPARR
jgi:hypothetical protein